MSPWWREQVRLFLAPDRLVAVRLSRGPRRRVLCQHVETFDVPSSDSASMLAGLETLLQQPGWGRADAVVLLSSRFASYQLLPWTDAVLDAEEAMTRTRQMFARAHGDGAAALDLRTSSGDYGRASLASGVDQRLLAAVRETCAAASLQVISIQPYLAAAFNACRSALPKGPHWFVVAECGTLGTAMVDRDGWISLRVRRIAGPLAEELLPALRRQALAQADVPHASDVLVHADGARTGRLPTHPDWNFRELPQPSARGLAPDRALELGPALVGVA